MKNFSINLICAVLTLSLFTTNAFAYGHLKYLDSHLAQGSLSYASLMTHQINYCIVIDPRNQAEFDDDSIDKQLRMALSLWLKPVETTINHEVKVSRVDCNSDNLDLKLAISPEPIITPHGFTLQANVKYLDGKTKPFTLVRVNTTKKCDSHELRTFNFKDLLEHIRPSSTGLQQAMESANSRKMSTRDFGNWIDVPEDTVACSTYPVLLHELGHGFFLCDVGKLHEGDDNCDPSFTTVKEDEAVMGNADYLYLKNDDIDGVTAVMGRFSSMTGADGHISSNRSRTATRGASSSPNGANK